MLGVPNFGTVIPEIAELARHLRQEVVDGLKVDVAVGGAPRPARSVDPDLGADGSAFREAGTEGTVRGSTSQPIQGAGGLSPVTAARLSSTDARGRPRVLGLWAVKRSRSRRRAAQPLSSFRVGFRGAALVFSWFRCQQGAGSAVGGIPCARSQGGRPRPRTDRGPGPSRAAPSTGTRPTRRCRVGVVVRTGRSTERSWRRTRRRC